MSVDLSEIEKIKLLRKGEFTGSLYFEFAPGGFSGEHWHESSIYLSDEVFELIEAAFIKTLPNFARYSFNEISRRDWESIIDELTMLKATLVHAPTAAQLREKMWIPQNCETLFFERFDDARFAVLKLITELLGWLNVQLETHETISVLGI